jgi:hypothetical protein
MLGCQIFVINFIYNNQNKLVIWLKFIIVRIDVKMMRLYLGWFEGVVRWDFNVNLEDAAFVACVFLYYALSS